ncbi:zinc finger protein [Trypanosoma grayi]|uniref:zinc finger protein n=1 Tax=Trypanosoma grayi TaxID=71804 RepID=UPI0004F46600|nr:zinc finger protein [Trypanosoma grayi]KEG08825.1 zinc finger protein [Trypanosoma grayi]
MCCDDDSVTRRPLGVCGWCLRVCSYVPPLVAALLILANVLPYYLAFLPRLRKLCMQGEASWLFYTYCHAVMAVAVVLVYLNFFLCICTPPGYVEREPWSRVPVYKGRAHSDNMYEVRLLGYDGKLRFCTRCEIYKPDNAHHCRQCRRCIYHMDHHCPWINNCVGRDNARFFLLFLAYIPLGAFHIAFTTAYSCYYQFSMHSGSEMVASTFHIVSLVTSLTFGITFSVFAGHFLWMAFRGETTVANMAPRQRIDKQQAMEEREKYLNDIFGSDLRWWRMICPVRTRTAHRTGNGGGTMAEVL